MKKYKQHWYCQLNDTYNALGRISSVVLTESKRKCTLARFVYSHLCVNNCYVNKLKKNNKNNSVENITQQIYCLLLTSPETDKIKNISTL